MVYTVGDYFEPEIEREDSIMGMFGIPEEERYASYDDMPERLQKKVDHREIISAIRNSNEGSSGPKSTNIGDLVDSIAISAMQGMLSNSECIGSNEVLVSSSYEIADLMAAERMRRRNEIDNGKKDAANKMFAASVAEMMEFQSRFNKARLGSNEEK